MINTDTLQQELEHERQLNRTDDTSRERNPYKEYLDVYEGIPSEIVDTTRFDENSDLSTTYLGKSDRSENDKLKAEESFPYQSKGTC